MCKTLSYQLTIYLAAVKIAEHLAAKGIPTSFPRVDKAQPGIFARKLYDLGLAIRRGGAQEVSPNDFDGEKDTFYLISGVNQGGKTTFVKSLGVAQLFAQNGLMVPAREYACPVYTGFVTHFPREEDENLYMGKLAEELTRFRKKLPLLVPAQGETGAFVVLNESFATTTEEEGAEIAADLLRALSEVRPALFFVTHNYHLLRGWKELQQRLAGGVSVASLITRGSAEGFRVVPGEPQENIHAFEYIKKYIAEQKAKAAAPQ